jgi:hypothetical protein
MQNANKPELNLQQIQQRFADYIRSPEERALPLGIDAVRMGIYCELFYNNVERFLADSFPVLHSMVSDDQWCSMVRDFYARHHCRTPLFTRLSKEFLDYLQEERGAVAGDPPYLVELAHYEWIELELALREADPLPLERMKGDLAQSRIRLSPLVWLLTYHYPVHRIGPGFQLNSPGGTPVCLLAYRDRQDEVCFLELDPLAHALLSVLQTVAQVQVSELLRTLAEMLNCESQDAFFSRGLALLEELVELGVIGRATVNDDVGQAPSLRLTTGG